MRMSFLAIPGIARSGLFVRVAGGWVESGGSAQASRKRVADVAKTSRISTIRLLFMPAPISVYRGFGCLRLQSPTLRRRNVGGDDGPEVHLSRGCLACGSVRERRTGATCMPRATQ